jgi:hypothetical protein
MLQAYGKRDVYTLHAGGKTLRKKPLRKKPLRKRACRWEDFKMDLMT